MDRYFIIVGEDVKCMVFFSMGKAGDYQRALLIHPGSSSCPTSEDYTSQLQVGKEIIAKSFSSG